MQTDNEDKKFGDVNLFLRLASEEYKAVWWRNGKADASILKRFAEGQKASRDTTRLKVPSYRHPDPYINPIFCQFGVSRPPIQFSRLMKVIDDPKMKDKRSVRMRLWHPKDICAKDTVLLGLSTRLDHEIGYASDQDGKNDEQIDTPPVSVPRRGRLGIAAGGATSENSSTRVARVFDGRLIQRRSGGEEEEEDKLKRPTWNGTLSADRFCLKRIGRQICSSNCGRAEVLIQKLRWMLTVSIELEASGPWFRYVDGTDDKRPFQRTVRRGKPKNNDNSLKDPAFQKGETYIDWVRWPWQEANRPLKNKPDNTALVEDTKAARGKKANLILSRLPGLRILSVDLGHRFAAACAVWEALSGSEFGKEVFGRSVESGGTGNADLYLHTRHEDADGKERVTIYRRIGPDTLPDGSAHPAPWARLDRQFIIKLQGEERPARKATQGEQEAVRKMKEHFGLLREKGAPLPKQVDELMSHAVHITRLALRRHGDRARIAFAMTAGYKPMPGDRKYCFPSNDATDGFNDKPGDRHKKHIEFIQDALLLWYGLFSSNKWKDEKAQKLWEQHIATLPGYQSPESIDEESSGPERKKKCTENFDKLRGTAEALIKDASLRSQLHAEWKKRWDEDDGLPGINKNRDATGWHSHIRWLQHWVRPSRDQSPQAIRNVGGLSLTRLATITELRRKVQVGFFTRLHPNGEKAQMGERFGQRTLDSLERMREQRVKQLASRIVEAALGLGRETASSRHEPKRPQERVYQPCHAVVIESLRNYRPDDLQTRRENRALMEWSSGRVRKYLGEACQLYGLHLREVLPNYTSRQCSRTGLPGIRCADVPVEQFRNAPFWRKTVNSAKKRLSQGKTAEEDKFFSDLDDKYGSSSKTPTDSRKLLRVPRKGGDLFIAALPWEHLNHLAKHEKCSRSGCPQCKAAKRALQADLNAAANIGLRALLDPDYSASWWYVPCNPKDGKAALDKVKGSTCFTNTETAFLGVSEKATAKRDIVNAWRDPSTVPLSNGFHWKGTTEYWNKVQARAVRGLRHFNGLAPYSSSPGS